MRYADRTSKAIEAVGGADALVVFMQDRKFCTNPTRTLETWLQRRRISGEGVRFIWKLAEEKGIRLSPGDFDIDAPQEAAA